MDDLISYTVRLQQWWTVVHQQKKKNQNQKLQNYFLSMQKISIQAEEVSN